MSISRWSLVRFVHVLATMGWVAGQRFLSVVVLPVLRCTVEPDVGGPLVTELPSASLRSPTLPCRPFSSLESCSRGIAA